MAESAVHAWPWPAGLVHVDMHIVASPPPSDKWLYEGCTLVKRDGNGMEIGRNSHNDMNVVVCEPNGDTYIYYVMEDVIPHCDRVITFRRGDCTLVMRSRAAADGDAQQQQQQQQ